MKRALSMMAVAMSVVLLAGCGGQKADENKPLEEVKAEAASLDTAKLEKAALAYKDAIMAKQGDVEKLMAELKEIPITEMMGDQAKELKGKAEEIKKSVSALTERYQVYVEELKAKGADLTGLEL